MPRLGPSGPRADRRQERRMAQLRRRHREHALLAARSNQRIELQQAATRVALQYRQPRPAPRIQPGRDAADGERHPLRHGRHAPRRGGAGCGHRRRAVGAQRERRPARPQRASPALRPRTLLLDRWTRRARLLRYARLPPGRAQREDRRAHRRLRQGRHGGSERRRRPDHRSRSPAKLVCTRRPSSRTTPSSSAQRIAPAACRAARPT